MGLFHSGGFEQTQRIHLELWKQAASMDLLYASNPARAHLFKEQVKEFIDGVFKRMEAGAYHQGEINKLLEWIGIWMKFIEQRQWMRM